MAVLKLMPHRLEWLSTTKGTVAPNGDYIAGSSVWQGSLPCSAVPNGSAKMIVFADGVARPYSYVITLSPMVRDFVVGERIRLTLIGGRQEEYSVQGFGRYQHLSKLWV